MRFVLLLLSAMAFLSGGGILGSAQSAIHEIEGFMLFLIGAVFLCGASVVSAIGVAKKQIAACIRESRPTSAAAHPEFPPPVSRQSVAIGDEANDEPHASQLLDQARTFARTGERESAISILQEILRRYPRTNAAEKARRSLNKVNTTR